MEPTDNTNNTAAAPGGQILLIEPSATLRHALQRVLERRGFAVVPIKSYDVAAERLRGPVAPVYRAILFGYPVHPTEQTESLLEAMRGARLRESAVLILAHHAEPAIFDWVARRAHSAMLLWDDYTECGDCLSKLLDGGPASSSAESLAAPADDIHVLLVDDSRTVRVTYERLLRANDYVVDTAANIADAMQKVRQQAFDIAIVDYYMPGGNGDVLCRRLRDDVRTAGMTTAILTGTYSDDVIRDSLSAGAVECMFKNEPRELFLARLAAMSRAVRGRKSIEAERQRLESILASVGDGVYGVNTNGQVTFINPAAREILGYGENDLFIGRSAHKLFHHSQEDGTAVAPDHSVLLRAYATGEVMLGWDTVFWHRSGEPVPVECTVYPLRIDGRLEGSVIAFRDVSERRILERELLWQATHDPLTRLHNRAHFERELESEVLRLKRSDERSALLYIDLDRFKYINDTAGHAAGDQLLIEIANHLQSRLRDSDLLARLGGDEFAIILRNVDQAAVMGVADGYRQILDQYTFVFGDRAYKVNGSIGVALMDRYIDSPGEALANADIACHIAKGRGRNQTHIYVPESDEKVAMNLELGWSARLKDALENDGFELHFQPIVPMADIGSKALPPEHGQLWRRHVSTGAAGQRLHYEVLVRFTDNRGELILPGAFLPTAERFSMMPQIDGWVVARAIAQLAALHAAGQPVVFTINLSGQTLDGDQLVPLVRRLLVEHTLEPNSLIFEITETTAIANVEAAKRLIDELRGLGCRFALDDFGSGFSSFFHLKHLPVDYIKIDGQFVQGMAQSAVDRSIVNSINDIAHSFGKQTIAEFVEDAACLELLRQCGVDFAQGYYISAPGPELPLMRGPIASTQN